MMSNIGATDNTEEVLVVRVDQKSTILHILYHNEKFSRVAKKIVGKNFQNIGLESIICGQCEARLHRVFINLQKEVFQLYIRNRYYQISYLPEWKGKGQIETVLTIVRDITKEQNLKEELTISQVKLQMAQQIAMLGYFDRDIVNDKLYCSDQVYKNFGLVPQETPPSIEFLLSRIHPEDVEMIRRGIIQIPAEKFLDIEYRIIKNDGSVGWIHSLIQAVFDNKGNLLKKFGIAQDITKRKKLELELTGLTGQLQHANKLLAARQMGIKMAGEIAKVGYFEWNQTNNHIYWSEQQYRNLGYTPEEVTPTVELFRSQVHLEDWNLVQTAVAALYEKSYLECQFRVIKADGSVGWLHSRINAMTNEQGCCVKIFGITQDVTDQKQTEERIHSVEKELAFMNQLHSRSTYLNRLLFNDDPMEQLTKALNEFGIETQVAHCCFVIQLTDHSAHNTARLDDMISPPIVRKQAVLIWLAERKWGLVWRCHDDIVILAPIADHIAANKKSQIEFANVIISEIEKVFPDFHVNVGISGISSIPVNFRDIYQKAHRSVLISTSMAYSSAIHCDDIGLYEVAFQLLQDKNTCAMVENTIGRLAEYDASRGSNLLLTLESILEHGSLKTVAQELFIHHNTVIWRKRRIEIFLDMTLDKMETKMLLMLYIKIWNLKKNIL